MILIGENINIMSLTIGPAFKERNPGPIQELAKAEVESGVDYLDLNIGPARKAGGELMEWVVNTVQEAESKPLSLDTTNLVAMEAGLKVARSKPVINSVSLQPDRMEQGLRLAKQYNADLISLLWGAEGMPRDANERAMHAVNFVYQANEMGIPNENIWIDPIASPVSVEINQVKALIEFMAMLADIAPGCKSVVGLSNISNGTPTHLRPWLNRTYLIMMLKHGLHSAIVDAFDTDLIALVRGKKPEIVSLIHRIMDGEKPDLASLSEEEVKYAKTVRVLTGESLYSHSWLTI
ncbi:MAG: dihydropteroate synthase [Dehalococcoidales bacterium]|nr:dihydropteroate synthase [Dehalococcoidales bacterium]MDP6576370.1 dihydropteroate synthase [Dehalococcoidales bacterium]MDP6824737.1 dihydropteroate synthase [Dehalococcoidales bacterium]